MTDAIANRLSELGITLPEPAAPVAAYVPAVEADGVLHISGPLPFDNGAPMTGRLREDRDLDYRVRAARACGLMLIAQMKKALASLDRAERIVKLGVFISSAGHFAAQPKVANGASALMEEVLGEAGRHTRSAVGMGSLPNRIAVEIECTLEVE